MHMKEQVKHRWRIRFGLRFLVLCVLACALACAWFARQLSEGRRHQQIAVKLQAIGCDIGFSHREEIPMANPPAWLLVGGGIPLEEVSTLPGFLERTGLALAFRRVSRVSIRSGSDISASLQLVKELGSVDSLSFGDTGVTQPQLANTMSSLRVRSVYLEGESLPRTRIDWLNHSGLTWLCVKRTQFSNPAIDNLPQSLQYLDATRTRINDDGLSSFVRLANLRSLDLRRTPTSGKAIEVLRTQMPWCTIKWEPLVRP
jgi:hypothetical protein